MAIISGPTSSSAWLWAPKLAVGSFSAVCIGFSETELELDFADSSLNYLPWAENSFEEAYYGNQVCLVSERYRHCEVGNFVNLQVHATVVGY